ncbi:Phage shock protein PspC (stress-responsive transcriptional regulator) [Robiginitalea myxolifaciens]|uniref:Phage shock protein PspC (Stress-responsive transcriptional regulator) n=1 Tax=Robiginitalea myxolifaciens TaxID=400055 RepID=A0A1I6FMW5_9FLAO|nr:PspC domain-containing protein [Robiginitalea myxolifaciens]SFR31293.1 Phage shock protein PspC (stress-responsive transcriptional regulator) [Robiginitalea myxolifaciens]
MNKTVNINLANMLFHIDENAYNKLQRYLEAVRRSFSGTKGSDEIIADIEARIAELFYEKMENERQVITEKEVDEVIAIMGQPEDYQIDEDIFQDAPGGGSSRGPASRAKKLYRDIDRKYIGGVCAGLEYYLGIDALWIRLIFILLAVFTGFGFIAYILLWILVPEAASTAQKLDMTGEPVNISNIERKVKEGFETVADRVKSVDYDEVGRKVKSGGSSFFDTLGDVIMFFFKVIGKFVGILLIIIGAVSLIATTIALFTVGLVDNVHIPGVDIIGILNATETPVWLLSFLIFLAFAIPFFFLMYLGLKILVGNLKSIGNIAKFSLLGLWLIAIISLAVLSIRQASAHAYTGSVTQRDSLAITSVDSLHIRFNAAENAYESGPVIAGMKIRYDENDQPMLYADDLLLDIRKADDSVATLRIRKDADGRSYEDARDRAGKINYNYALTGTTLNLDNYFTTDVKNKVRDQEMRLTLYLPEGTYVSFDRSARNYIGRRTSTDRDMYRKDIAEHAWIMGADGRLQCQECPEELNDRDWDDEEGDNRIIIDENGVDIDLNDNDDSFKMKIDENGVQIKADEGR